MKTNWIVGLTVAMLVLARPAYSQGTQNNFTTTSTQTIDIYNTTTVNQQVNQFSTELIRRWRVDPFCSTKLSMPLTRTRRCRRPWRRPLEF